MLRTRRLPIPVCLAAGLFGMLAWATPAVADEGDATLTVVVLRDADNDGVYDAATDPPQPGIGITVSDADGSSVSGVTDDRGIYQLDPPAELDGGRYFVVAEIPKPLDELTPVQDTESFQPMSTTVDLSSESQEVRMAVAVRNEPAADPSTESPRDPAGPQPTVTRFAVGDRVWIDSNGSGTQDTGETPAARVSVQLLDRYGDVVDTTTTSATGRYMFDGLAAGRYSVRFAGLPTGYKLAPAGRGAAGEDSDPDYSGSTPFFTLGAGEANVRATAAGDHVAAALINTTVDAGITPLRYAVGSQVWLDANRDGLRQAEEPAAAATVNLLDERGSQLATTTTDPRGAYRFDSLKPGRYRLEFTGLPANRSFTKLRAGNSDLVDSDVDPRTGRTAVFTLSQNAADLTTVAPGAGPSDFVNATLGAGLVGSYSLGDTVWRDADADGVLGPGDAGVAEVTVELLDAAGDVVATRVTSEKGRFTFGGLPSGNYRLRFTDLPDGLVFVAQRVGANAAVDSDPTADGVTGAVVLGEDNPVDTSVDAGLTTPADLPLTAAAAAASGTVTDGTLSGTGGVSRGVPFGALALSLAGAACLVAARRRAANTS